MKKILLIAMAILVICLFMGCENNKAETENIPTKPSNMTQGDELSDIIVVYFSATNNTRTAAQYIAKELHCGLYEIVPTQKYTKEDLDWQAENSRVNKEHENPNILPEMQRMVPELSVYKTLIIGYPIWYGEAPAIMRSFLKNADPIPNGLTVIPFCTSHSSPMGNSAKNLFKDVKNINLQEGKRFELEPSQEEVVEWVKSLDLK